MKKSKFKKAFTAALAGLMVSSSLIPMPALASSYKTPDIKPLQYSQIMNIKDGALSLSNIINAQEAQQTKGYVDESKWYSNNILGKNVMSAETMAKALTDVNKNVSKEYALRIAKDYLEISEYYGLRGDIAFFQAMVETAWLKGGGGEDDDYHNFAGIMNDYVTGYAVYDSAEEGIEAHIQLLYGYATTAPFPSTRPLVEKRAPNVDRGFRPIWESLGGTWAVPGYDETVFRSWEEARTLHKTYGDIVVGCYAAAGGTDVQTSVLPGRAEPYMSNPDYVGTALGPKIFMWKELRGDAVTELKEIVKTLGYKVTEGGYFDDALAGAIKEIQKAGGLDVDGVVGGDTWAYIADKYLEKTQGIPMPQKQETPTQQTTQQQTNQNQQATPAKEKTPDEIIAETNKPQMFPGEDGIYIKAIQQLLNAQGYNLEVDSDYGSLTYRAVIKFQKEKGLDQDGIVGAMTWKALIDGYNASKSGTTQTEQKTEQTKEEEKPKEQEQKQEETKPTETKPEEKPAETKQEEKQTETANLPSVNNRPVLYKWKEGSDVTALQTLLNHHGAKLDVDGVFGGDTENAVLSFQKAKGLDVDGVVGEKTWAALGKDSGAKPENKEETKQEQQQENKQTSSKTKHEVLSWGDDGEEVKTLQNALNKNGASIEVDGIFGGETYRAVTEYQKAHNLDVDGIVGEMTWGSLGV